MKAYIIPLVLVLLLPPSQQKVENSKSLILQLTLGNLIWI